MGGQSKRSNRQWTPNEIKHEKNIGYHRDRGDNAARGLYLQVMKTKTGTISRSWIYRYVYAVTGIARWMGLGPSDVISLAKARELARDARAAVVLKKDPIEQRRQEHVAIKADALRSCTFKDATEQYLAVHNPTWKNSKHRQQWANTLRDHAYPKLGSLPVGEIETAAINDAIAPIWNETPETARRVRQRVNLVIQWIKDGRPMPVVKNGNGKSHFPALPWQQAPEFMADLRTREGIAARALELLILCAARSGDIIGNDRDDKPPMLWPHVDFAHKVWTIPSTKTEVEHRVPLSDRAVAILKSLPREKGSDIVFPGGKVGKPLSNGAMAAVVDRMNADRTAKGLARYTDPKQDNRDVVPHGFRSTFRDWCSESTNYPHAVAEKALAHAIKDKVEGAYRRGDLLQKRVPLMRDWAHYCETPPAAGDNVTPLHARAS
jgi:integrase